MVFFYKSTCQAGVGGGVYSTDAWVGRCGSRVQTPTPTQCSDFPIPYKTEFKIFRPSYLSQQWITNGGPLQITSVYFIELCFLLQKPNRQTSKLILFIQPLRHVAIQESDEIDTPFKTKHPENHTVSSRTSPLSSHKGVTPGCQVANGFGFTIFLTDLWILWLNYIGSAGLHPPHWAYRTFTMVTVSPIRQILNTAKCTHAHNKPQSLWNGKCN